MIISAFGKLACAATGALLLTVGVLAQTPLDTTSSDTKGTWVPTVVMPWINYAGDFGGVAGWNEAGIADAQRAQQVEEYFSRLDQAGVRVVTWFLLGDGRGALKFDAAGAVEGLASSFVADYQTALQAARKHNLKLMWVVLDYQIGLPPEDVTGVHKFGRADLIEDPAKRRAFIENALDPILQASGDFQQIAGWIVINEPENLLRKGYVSEASMRSFVREVTWAIKRQNKEQRVAIANRDLLALLQFSDIDRLDFFVLHHYLSVLPPPSKLVQEYILERQITEKKAKPIYIGEFNLISPSGGDLDRFLLASRAFGYAGVWPWSLLQNLEGPVSPQFDAVIHYASNLASVAAPSVGPTSSGEELRRWAMSHSDLDAGSLEQSITAVKDELESNRKELEINEKWEAEIQNELVIADQNLKRAPADRQQAQKDIRDNEKWVSTAPPNESETAKANLARSQEWLKTIDARLQLEEVHAQEHNLACARVQILMHSYLAREDQAELTWLLYVRGKLQNPDALSSMIGKAFGNSAPPTR